MSFVLDYHDVIMKINTNLIEFIEIAIILMTLPSLINIILGREK